MASGFHVAFFLCLTGGLLISGTWSANVKRSYTRCPAGWSQCEGRCFIVETRRMTMADAERACIARGGNLASIHSAAEHNFIRNLIRARCGYDVTTLIGLFDAVQEGTWMWTDGSRVDYTVWAGGEPNNAGGENCVETNFRGTATWNDVPCRFHYPSVCAMTL